MQVWLAPHETAADSVQVLCTPCNHAPCHFMQSHIHKVYACLAVTCHLHFWQNDWDLLRATADGSMVTECREIRHAEKHTHIGGRLRHTHGVGGGRGERKAETSRQRPRQKQRDRQTKRHRQTHRERKSDRGERGQRETDRYTERVSDARDGQTDRQTVTQTE